MLLFESEYFGDICWSKSLKYFSWCEQESLVVRIYEERKTSLRKIRYSWMTGLYLICFTVQKIDIMFEIGFWNLFFLVSVEDVTLRRF